MRTTALLVEILIIGFEVCLCLLVVLAILPNKAWICALLSLSKDNAFIAAGALAAMAYLLGIVADKTAKWIVESSRLCYLFQFKPRPTLEQQEESLPCRASQERGKLHESMAPLLQRLLQPYAVKPPENVLLDETRGKYSRVVLKANEPVPDLLYARSKVRILRASIFVLPVISLLGTIAAVDSTLPPNNQPERWLAAVLIAAVGLVLTLALARYINWLYCYNLSLFRQNLDHFHARILETRPER